MTDIKYKGWFGVPTLTKMIHMGWVGSCLTDIFGGYVFQMGILRSHRGPPKHPVWIIFIVISQAFLRFPILRNHQMIHKGFWLSWGMMVMMVYQVSHHGFCRLWWVGCDVFFCWLSWRMILHRRWCDQCCSWRFAGSPYSRWCQFKNGKHLNV